jgi:uncharacterized protein
VQYPQRSRIFSDYLSPFQDLSRDLAWLNADQKQWIETDAQSASANIRILQLDVLRGLAVLGIYWINIIIFALPSGSYYLPVLSESIDLAQFINWSFTEIFVEGTMRGLFSILFGASAMVFLDEARLSRQGLDMVDRYYRRSLLLLLFGLIHSYLLLWPYDVLYAYGLLGLFLFPLRTLSSRTLLTSGCLLLLSSHISMISGFSDYLPAIDNSAHDDVAEITKPSDNTPYVSRDEIRKIIEDNLETAHYHASYAQIMNYQLPQVIEQHSSAMYTQHLFDIGGMMLIGMALLKLGILSGKRSRRFYLLMAASGYLAGFIIRSIGIYLQLEYDFDLFENETQAGIDYDIGRLPITLGHIGLIGVLCQSSRVGFLIRSLAATGRLALTNYIMQTVISIFLFYGFGLALFNTLSYLQVILTCLAVWIFQVSFSLYWLRYFKLGPLEWLWRSLIYGKRQALRLA